MNFYTDALGTTPKRRKTNEQKQQHDIEKHPLREPCTCKDRCIEKIPQRRRIDTWIKFWKLDYYNRKNFIHQAVQQCNAKTSAESTRSRSVFYKYALTNVEGVKVNVCKIFFLSTLGFSRTSSIIDRTKKSTPSTELVAAPDKRGSHTPAHAMDHQLVDSHIDSYNAGISHYRREHAPKRLYLPHELSVDEMHKDYLSKHPDNIIHYSTYLRRIQVKNISFAKLGMEECEICNELTLVDHEQVDGICIETCQPCAKRSNHKLAYKEARQAYELDGKTMEPCTIVRSVDLQKVIMLPRIPGLKTVCFTRRLIIFHETFAPVGVYKTAAKPTQSVVWHEGIAGRKCEDIASTFLIALKIDRDYQHIIYYMDNCAAQNKNWTLFTALTNYINSDLCESETITFKYLEAGHTFMSADSIHAEVEGRMKKAVNVYDFNDFKQCVGGRSGKVRVTVPDITEFIDLKAHQSQPKLQAAGRPMLNNIRAVKFSRGNRQLCYKLNHGADTVWQDFDFLKSRYKLNSEQGAAKTSLRGISELKKKGLIKNLAEKHMPVSRRAFWQNLTVTTAVDLISEYE